MRTQKCVFFAELFVTVKTETSLPSSKEVADYIRVRFDAMKDYVPVENNDAFLYELTRKNVQNIDI